MTTPTPRRTPCSVLVLLSAVGWRKIRLQGVWAIWAARPHSPACSHARTHARTLTDPPTQPPTHRPAEPPAPLTHSRMWQLFGLLYQAFKTELLDYYVEMCPVLWNFMSKGMTVPGAPTSTSIRSPFLFASTNGIPTAPWSPLTDIDAWRTFGALLCPNWGFRHLPRRGPADDLRHVQNGKNRV